MELWDQLKVIEVTIAGEKVAAEILTDRSANEKGPVNKKIADWLLLMVRSWRGVVSLMFRLFFYFFLFQ